MEHDVGEYIIGTVTQVRPYALFMTFEEGEKGLLHISEISDDFIRDIEYWGSVGDEMRVKVIDVDKFNGFLRVSLKRVPKKYKYSTHDNSKRIPPDTDNVDFSLLASKLPEWTENTLKKARENKDDED